MAKSKKDGVSQGNGYASRKWWIAIIGMIALMILSLRTSPDVAKAGAPGVSVIIAVYIGSQAYADGQAQKHR